MINRRCVGLLNLNPVFPGPDPGFNKDRIHNTAWKTAAVDPGSEGAAALWKLPLLLLALLPMGRVGEVEFMIAFFCFFVVHIYQGPS